jgi:hypothetical protein
MSHVDLNRLIAERRAKQGELFTFDFGDHTYHLAPRMDFRVIALMTKGEVHRALELLLGAEQWEMMLAEPEILDDDTLKDLLASYAEYQGSPLGESSASTGSSKSTGGPSKPTSNGSTPPTSQRSLTVT